MKNRIAMRQVFALTAVLIIATVVASAGLAQQTLSIPPHGKLKPLFNGQNFKGFETLLQKHGINNDPDKVFQVEDGALHISGQEFGGLVTKKEYENYYLRAEFKWGEKMYPPRLGKTRDSGIQYNLTGPLKVWSRMMEFQINEGGTGDIWVINGTGVTVDGQIYQSTAEPGPKQYIRIPHIGRGPLVNATGYRDPVNDLEKPHGEWNLLELVVDHDRILYFVNGKLANAGTKANTTRGRILFQCEGAEAYFRKMEIAHLK
jgi:Domain of Unknown Function (DUF1080)